MVVATFNDGNPSAPVSSYTVTIDWGDNSSSTGTVVADPNGMPGQFQVFGNHTYAQGTYGLSVSISDPTGPAVLVHSSVVVPNAPISASGLIVASQVEGQTFNDVPLATFTDGNPGDPASSYTATINWGDNSSSTGTVVPLPGGSPGEFQVLGTHAYSDIRSYTVTVSVADDGNSGTASAQTTIDVLDAPIRPFGPDVTITGLIEGQTFDGVVGRFQDANLQGQAGEYRSTITWGDGSTSRGTIVATGPGTFEVRGSHPYATVGPRAIAVTITDIGNAAQSLTLSASANVVNAPITAVGRSITALEGVPFQGVVATFTDGNPIAKATDYTITILPANGGPPVPGIARPLGNGAFEVIPSQPLTFAEIGPDSIRVTIKDNETTAPAQANAFSPLTVVNAPITTTGLIFTGSEDVSQTFVVVASRT